MPKVFLTDLHAYNSGSLHGKWVEVTDDVEDLHAAFREILASSPHPGGEEWFISDYDEFEGYSVGEYEPLEQVVKVATAIDEHGEAVALWLASDASNLDQLDDFTDYFIGEVEGEEDYEKEMYTELVIEPFKAALRFAAEQGYESHLLTMFERSIEDHIDLDRASNGMASDVTFLVAADGTTYAFRDER